MLRQSTVVTETAEDAWLMLMAQGQCYLRLYGLNLAELRQLYAAWLERTLEEVMI